MMRAEHLSIHFISFRRKDLCMEKFFLSWNTFTMISAKNLIRTQLSMDREKIQSHYYRSRRFQYKEISKHEQTQSMPFSNIMLNYTLSGKVNQIRFVDFQLCKWGSPAQDLWELIVCSVLSNLCICQFDQFIRIYHAHLLKCEKVLNYAKPPPKLSHQHISMLKYGLQVESYFPNRHPVGMYYILF